MAKPIEVKPVVAVKKKKESLPFIQPLIRVDGQKHVLEQIMDENPEDMPVLEAVGYVKVAKDRQHSWMSYVIKTKGKEVLSIEASEPDMRAVAEEAAKISFVDRFIDQEI